MVEAARGKADVIVMSPTTWGRLSKLKGLATDSNQPLLDVDGGVIQAQMRTLFGMTVHVDHAVAADVIGVWDSSAVATAMRRDVRVESDASRYFDTDSVAVRATLWADWKVLDPARVVRPDASTG